MSERRFKERLHAREPLFGTLLSIGAVEVAELLAGAGFDWLFVDGEHGAFDSRDLLHLLQAVGGRTPCLVRVPALDEGWIKRALDAGAEGIIVPQIASAAEAARAVSLAHYPPRGRRGLGTGRANRYGMGVPAALQEAADRTVVVVQAESRDAVDDIAAIVRVPGVDAVFVGPFDLSASIGRPGEVDHPSVSDAISRVGAACREAGRPAGIFAMGAAGLAPWAAQGFTLLAAGVDTVLLGEAAAGLRRELMALPSPGRRVVSGG